MSSNGNELRIKMLQDKHAELDTRIMSLLALHVSENNPQIEALEREKYTIRMQIASINGLTEDEFNAQEAVTDAINDMNPGDDPCDECDQGGYGFDEIDE